MGCIRWHNGPMRWPWSGIQDELRLLREQHVRHIEEYRSFTTELVMDMRRHAEARERAVDQRLDEIHDETQAILAEQRASREEMLAENRAGREALLRILDRLPPAPGTA